MACNWLLTRSQTESDSEKTVCSPRPVNASSAAANDGRRPAKRRIGPKQIDPHRSTGFRVL